MALCVYESRGEVPRTEWTQPEGEEQFEVYNEEMRRQIMGLEARPVVLRPGDHYIALPWGTAHGTEQYFLFPDIPALSKFRHAWVIVRNKRPYVLVLEGAPLPNAARKAEDNARYCSVLFSGPGP